MCPLTKPLRSSSVPTVLLCAQASSACWMVGGWKASKRQKRKGTGASGKRAYWVGVRDRNLAAPLGHGLLLVGGQVERRNPGLDLARLDPSGLGERVLAVKCGDDGDVRLVEAGRHAEALALKQVDGGRHVLGEQVVQRWQKGIEESRLSLLGRLGGILLGGLLAPGELERRAVDDDVVVVLWVEGFHL